MTRTYEAPAVLGSGDVVAATNASTGPSQEGQLFGIDVTAGFCL